MEVKRSVFLYSFSISTGKYSFPCAFNIQGFLISFPFLSFFFFVINVLKSKQIEKDGFVVLKNSFSLFLLLCHNCHFMCFDDTRYFMVSRTRYCTSVHFISESMGEKRNERDYKVNHYYIPPCYLFFPFLLFDSSVHITYNQIFN